MAEDIYSIGALTKRYASPDGDEEFTLEVPSLTIRRGQRVGIVAESGSGKSTLLDLLLFALKPSSAESFVFRTDDRSTGVAEAWRAGGSGAFSDIRKHHIGAVIQTGGLLPFVSARANIELPCRILGRPYREPAQRLAEHLDIVAQLDLYPRQLSIGQRQRVAIARALVHQPLLVIADEPTASLDSGNAQRVMELLVDLTEGSGVTLIMASHDLSLVSRYGFNVLNHERAPTEGDGPRSRFWSA